ncbi:TPA: hypothetical protein ACNRZF_002130 [Escherichia coli]
MKGDEAFSKNDVLVGWGKKSNTKQIKQKAQELGISYWQLEDGFIGYIGHPAKGGKAVSLIADPLGIYYDAHQTSQLEQLIIEPVDTALLARAEHLISDILRLGITKYNCYTNSTEHTFNGSVRATDGPSLDLPTHIQPELFTLTAHSNLARLLDDPRPRITVQWGSLH